MISKRKGPRSFSRSVLTTCVGGLTNNPDECAWKCLDAKYGVASNGEKKRRGYAKMHCWACFMHDQMALTAASDSTETQTLPLKKFNPFLG